MKVTVIRKEPSQVASCGFLRLAGTETPQALVIAPEGASLTELALILLEAEGVQLVAQPSNPHE